MEYSEEEKRKICRLSPTLRTIIKQLEKGINQVINGECNYIDVDKKEILENLSAIISPQRLFSKYQVAKMLKVSEKQIERYVKEGKLEKPIKQQGFKELGWSKLMVEKCKCLLKNQAK